MKINVLPKLIQIIIAYKNDKADYSQIENYIQNNFKKFETQNDNRYINEFLENFRTKCIKITNRDRVSEDNGTISIYLSEQHYILIKINDQRIFIVKNNNHETYIIP